MGEPLNARVEFTTAVKNASIESLADVDNLQAADFKLEVKSGAIELRSKVLIDKPILELWLNIEFVDDKNIRQRLTLLLPIAQQAMSQPAATAVNTAGFKNDLLNNKVKALKTQLGGLEDNLNKYRKIAAILAILILLGFWFGLRYRRKLLNLNTKSSFMDKKSSTDNNDYLLEIANLYLTQEKFTEAENLAQEVLLAGSNIQQKQAQTILDAKA